MVIGSVEWFRERARVCRAEAWDAAGYGGAWLLRANTFNAEALAYDRAADALEIVESAQGAEPLPLRVTHDDGDGMKTWKMVITYGGTPDDFAASLVATALKLRSEP